MLIKRLPVVLLCLIKIHGVSVSFPLNPNNSVHKATADITIPQILGLSDQLSQMTFGDNIPEEQASSKKPSLSSFEISEQMGEIINKISDCDTKSAVEMIEKGLGQILDSGACLNDIAPTIGSLPIEAKELVLAAIESKAYTLLKLVQRAYIWCDEHQYHWFMALSYGSPWYDKETWENLTSFPLNWKNNLRAICETDNGALVKMVQEDIPLGGALESFNEELLLLSMEHDAIKVFESARLDPTRLEKHFELLAKNSAAKLLQLYQTHTKISHLHLEEFPFPDKSPANGNDLKFLMDNGHDCFRGHPFITRFCFEGRLDLLIHMYESSSEIRMAPSEYDLEIVAKKGWLDILQWAHSLGRIEERNSSRLIANLAINLHFKALDWLLNATKASINDWIIDNIISAGALKALQWIDKRQPKNQGVQAWADVAAEKCHFDTLKWLYERFELLPSAKSLKNATVEMLIWIKSKNAALINTELVGYGARNFELLKWVFENAPPSIFERREHIFKESVNSKEMMLWLYTNLNIRLFNMNWAYKTGDLETIQWAENEFGITPTEGNISEAAVRGHLHIIKWIYEKYPPKPLHIFQVLASVIQFGDLKVAEYFKVVEYLISCSTLVETGHVDTAKHVNTNQCLDVSKPARLDNFNDVWKYGRLYYMIEQEDLQAIERFTKAFPDIEPDSHLWYKSAEMGRHEIYKWLLEKYPEKCQKDRLCNNIESAYYRGHLEIVKMILNEDPSLVEELSLIPVSSVNHHIKQWIITKGLWPKGQSRA